MLLPFDPILTWELFSVVRRKRYFLLRLLFAGVLFLALTSAYGIAFWDVTSVNATTSIGPFAKFADSFFVQYGFLQLSMVLLLTPAYVASTVASEKQRRTLEFLFLTDLGSTAIIVGKWAARTLNILLLLGAGIPIVCLASLFGGIDFRAILELNILTASAAAATAALAMLISANTKHTRDALFGSYLVLIFLLISPYLITGAMTGTSAMLKQFGAWGGAAATVERYVFRAAEILTTGSPIVTYQSFAGMGRVIGGIGEMVQIHAGVIASCLLLSIVRLRPAYLRSLSEAPKRRKRVRRLWKTPAVFDPPMVWKEWHFDVQRSTGPFAAVAAAVLILGVLGAPFFLHEYWYLRYRDFGPLDVDFLNHYLRTIQTGLVAIAYVLVAIRAASSIGIERDRQCGDSLLLTGLSPREVLSAKILGAIKPVAWLWLLLLPIWLLAFSMNALSPLAVPLFSIALFVFAVAVAAIGLHQSLARRTIAGAIGATLAICFVLCQFAQFYGALVVLPLVLLGVDSTTVQVMLSVGNPLFLLATTGFIEADLSKINSPFVVLFCIGAILLVYSVLSVIAFRWSVGRYDECLGRTDSGDRRGLPSSEIRGLALQRAGQTVAIRKAAVGSIDLSVEPALSSAVPVTNRP